MSFGLGLVGAAMGGLGEGMQNASKVMGESLLRQELEKIREAREKRLAEIKHGLNVQEIEKRERLKRQPAIDAAADIERARSELVDDPSGTARPRTADEMRTFSADAYRRRGAPDVALQLEEADARREREARLERDSERRHGERMSILQKTLNVQEKMLQKQFKLDGNDSTALTTNIRFLVDQGVADSPKAAFDMLRTRVSKSPHEAIAEHARTLLRLFPQNYRGKDGQANAAADARNFVDKIRAGDDAELETGFNRSRPLGAGPRRPLDAFLSGDEEE